MSLDAELAEVIEWLYATEPPAAVEKKARELVLDTLGCVLAASRRPRLQNLAEHFAAADPGAVRVPGFGARLSVASACALFAVAAGWDEACEGLARAHGRPGVPVTAACAALAQVRSSNLHELLSAFITGYEIGGRLGEAMRIAPGMHVDGAWPGFGVAAAAVRLSGGNAADALSAVRVAACQMPYSLYLPVRVGAEARYTYLAHSAQLGLLAASAALTKLSGPDGALDELRARAFAHVPPGAPLAPPGAWLIADAYLKPYAGTRHLHYGVAAALALRPGIANRLREISRIELSTYAEALTYCGIRAPANAIQAQFSLSYGVARALVAGDLAPEAYSDDALREPLVRELEAKVELVEDPALTAALVGTGRRVARLVVESNGKRLEHTVDRVLGDPSLPMTRDQVLEKFARYSGRTLEGAVQLLDAPGDRRFGELLFAAGA